MTTEMSNPTSVDNGQTQDAGQRVKLFLARSGLFVALIILFIVLSLVAPNFLTTRNLLNVLRQVSFVGIIACGMTIALIGGDVDLSVGSVVALTSSVLAVLYVKAGLPLWLAIVIAIAQAGVVGSLAGLVRVRWNIPALIVTIALMISLRGVAFVLTDAFPIPITDEGFAFWGGGYVLGVPVPVIFFAVVFLFFLFLSTRTVYGRSVYAVGGNAEAARLSGIPVNRIRIMLLTTTGLLAGLSGFLLTSRLTSGYSGVGVGWEFDVIAAVLIGGASLNGGEGTILGTLFGVLFIGLLANGMVLMGVNPYVQDVVRGAIILLAVWLSTIQKSPASA